MNPFEIDATDFLDSAREAYESADPAMQTFINDQVEQFREQNRIALCTMYSALESTLGPAVIFPQDAACRVKPYIISVLWFTSSGENATAQRELIKTTFTGNAPMEILHYGVQLPRSERLEDHVVSYRWDLLNKALGRKNDFPIREWYAEMLR